MNASDVRNLVKPEKLERMEALADIRELLLLVKRRLHLIIAVTIATAGIALLLAIVLPSRYSAEAIVMLDSRKAQVSPVPGVMTDVATDLTAVNSEIDIITSRAVIDRVITKLGLLKDPDFNKRLSGISWLNSLLGRDNPSADEAEADRSRIAAQILKKLSVKNSGRSYSITISYSSNSPKQAQRITNAVVDEYLVDQMEAKYEITQRANTWLGSRIEQLRKEVEVAEKAVEDYKVANNLLGVGEETLTEKQMIAINSQLVEARAERSQAEARLKSIEDTLKVKGNLEAASTVLSSPLIQRLKEQEAEVGRRAAEMSMRYGDRHPTIINARAELRDIRNKISEEVQKIVQGMRNDVDIANAKVASLQSELDTVEGRTGQGNQAMVTLRQLMREAASSRSLYEGFLQRSKQVAEQQSLQLPDSRVIARAELPLKPYFPNKLIFIVLGTMLGGVLGLALVLVLEHFDRGFRSINEIEQITGLPGIGMIPMLDDLGDKGAEDYVLEKPLSAYAESLRTVRTAIHFSNVDNPPKVVMVTSSVPDEGKTTFAMSMVRVLAKGGAKVLLIDADLRRPRAYSMLKLDKSKPDLAAVLAGEAIRANAIQKDVSGADIIISHGNTPNPQDLLGSKQMQNLLNGLRANYDMVVIDTPPMMAVADAAMVAAMADTSIYVVRWVSTPREVVLQGLKQITGFGVKLAGIVMTQVNLEEQAQYSYGDYGYYYGRYKDYYNN